MGETSDKLTGAANKVAGSVKQAVGDATDNPRLEGEGAAQKAKGHVQTSVGEAKGAVKNAIDKL